MSLAIPKAVQNDGFSSLLAGVNAAVQPSLIGQNQAWQATNITFRNGYAQTRPGWTYRKLNIPIAYDSATFLTGNPQGLKPYISGDKTYLIASINGSIFSIDVDGGFKVQNCTPPGKANAADLPKAYMCQADEYFIIQDGVSKPIILNGLTGSRAGDKQVPVGTAMAYGWGRLWVSNTQGTEFVAGDILGGDTSVISFTETTYFAEGGAFRIPATVGKINGMAFIPLQDTATGQGQLLVGADYGVASINGGIPRSQWKETQIQQIALLDIGWVGQDSAALLNGDVFYRAYDGIRSYRMARAQQGYNGNTPQSSEVQQHTSSDTDQLLKYGSAVYFDQRILVTTSPQWKGTYCYHKGLLVLDSNPQSSMQSKAPPAWEGLWDGLNIVQITKGIFNKKERCFALVRNIDDTVYGKVNAVSEDIPLRRYTITVADSSRFIPGKTYQIQNSGYWRVEYLSGAYEVAFSSVGGVTVPVVGSEIKGGEYNEIWELSKDEPFEVIENEKRRIGCKLWTRSFTHGSPFNQKRLYLGDLFVEDGVGTVDWQISYRPDQYPCMYEWKSGTLCSEEEVCNQQCPTNLNRHPTYKPRITFAAPSDNCNPVTGNTSNLGYEFQWLIEWQGHWKLRGVREICVDVVENTKGTC